MKFRHLYILLALTCFLLGHGIQAQELQIDPTVEPSQVAPQSSKKQPAVLKGRIQTLDLAIEAESGIVDWYGWYMACREYLMMTGGFQCPKGTIIRFYKNGKIKAQSNLPMCRMSAQIKHFPLPQTTQLKALELPIRGDALQVPPASEAELLKQVKSQSKS